MKIAVIGGGLTGSLTALEFAGRGHGAIIFDRADDLLTRASTANEGKIHLGYVYAADTSFATAARLIDDALTFRPVLERWMSASAFEACLCAPFSYTVPAISRLPLDQIELHFRRVESRLRDRMRVSGSSYLGQAEMAGFARTALIADTHLATYATPERGVWTPGIAQAVRDSVRAHPGIEVVTAAHIDRVEPDGEKWRLRFAAPFGASDGPFDVVVNAAWADRRNIDSKSGFPDRRNWYTRFKFGVALNRASEAFGGALPANVTAMSGAFGDSIHYPQTDSIYCSWYPVGMCFSTAGQPGTIEPIEPDDRERLMRDTWRGYAAIDPAYRRLETLASPVDGRLVGDYIVARGASDIGDPDSELHQRSTHGPSELAGGYWTVETGKYTSAPRCAVDCVGLVLGLT